MLWRLAKAGKERLARRSESNRRDLSNCNSIIFPTKGSIVILETITKLIDFD